MKEVIDTILRAEREADARVKESRRQAQKRMDQAKREGAEETEDLLQQTGEEIRRMEVEVIREYERERTKIFSSVREHAACVRERRMQQIHDRAEELFRRLIALRERE
ncbi:MAG: hypothetical protein GF333_06195 [Candidatus Omnitrophica bacterium]|nr:hypothetical protein [Candidatus Omnitrophota bacterium]